MNKHNLTKFCIHIIIDKILDGIVKRHFCKFATGLRPLIDVRVWVLLKILRMDGQNLTKFCIHIITDNIYVEIVMRYQFFKQSYVPEYIFAFSDGGAISRSSDNSS